MIWREKRVLLAILGVLLLANAVFFLTYRVQYQSRLDSLDDRLAEAERTLESTRQSRLKAEQTLQSYKKVENDVLTVFDEHWSTQTQRLTVLIAEVKRLAVASSLVPTSYGFSRGETKEVAGLSTARRRETLGASEMRINFSVQGTYAQARRLINLLELSRQFVIIDAIGLSSADAETLSLNLQLKTLFRDAPQPEQGDATATNRL
jgi:Tfp pilus assembly protein PilO